jgi:formate dehydrogenase subunit delta
MANQIGSFFATQRSADPKAGIANHIEKFWEPRMREAIFAHIEHGGEGLQDIVLDALVALKAKRRS